MAATMMKRTATILLALVVLAVSCASAAAPPGQNAYDARFSDVDPNSAEGMAIDEMAERGVIGAASGNLFEPEAPISAADYVTMLAKLRELHPASGTSSSPDAGYMQAALDAHWYDWDEIPPDDPGRYDQPITRELAANILITAFFGTVSYDWSVHEEITDFDQVGGRYYAGVLGGLTLGLFNQTPGTPFNPLQPLSRGAACLWAANALKRSSGATPAPTSSPSSSIPAQSPAPEASTPAVTPASGSVSKNGWLQVNGTQLCNEEGDPIILHGMSSMGIQWYPQYTNVQSISNTVERGANVFRIAMYTEEGGYLSDKPKFTRLVEEIVENAVRCDVYVIIDWHILSDGNPMTHLSEAAVFFDEMSQRYASTPNVIYEICNEPNGNITWAGNVKPYAEQIVSVIRKNSPRGIILIGNPMWDQDVDIAAADPVAGENLMYTLHFYAGTHHQELRDKAARALNMGAPIFVSEWGTSAADGSGGVFIDSSNEWMEFMKEHNLSWCNWSLCDKNETSAALVPGAPSDTAWTERDLSTSGQYVFTKFTFGVPQTPEEPQPVIITPVTASEAAERYASLHPNDSVTIWHGSTRLTGDEIVSTGCRAIAYGTTTSEADIVVPGDVLGTGEITLSQLVRMAQALTGTRPLEGLYALAADVDNASGFGITDLVVEARLITDGGALTCRFVKSN